MIPQQRPPKSCWALSASLGCRIQTAPWRAQKQPRPISESQRPPFLPGNGGGGWEVICLTIFAVAALVPHSSSVFLCSDGGSGARRPGVPVGLATSGERPA